jgi:glycosyltransferase involved in cell wall biosynthesis
VRKDDAVSLASAINLLADDPGLRARLGAEGRATAAAYSWDRVVDQVVQVYEESLLRFNPNRVGKEEERVHYAIPGLG